MGEASANPLPAVGVDAGASLWKLARRHSGGWDTELIERDEIEPLRRSFAPAPPAAIGVTGGGAVRLAEALAPLKARVIAEFDAWIAGAPIVAELAGVQLVEPYLLVSVGTGASAILVRGGGGLRVGGTALGGGSLVGLGQLLVGTGDFDELVELARRGDRSRVDLLVGDLYAQGAPPLPPQVPAAHFAKLESRAEADVAHALVGMVGHNLALICGQLALTHGAAQVVYCGSTLRNNSPLREVLELQTAAYGVAVVFPQGGAFCGAIGAAALVAR